MSEPIDELRKDVEIKLLWLTHTLHESEKKELENQFIDLIKHKETEARIDERRTFRRLWNALRMQFGASAGSAVGVLVKNDFDEEFEFQLDREAVNSIFAYLNAELHRRSEGGE